jgi:fructokinase
MKTVYAIGELLIDFVATEHANDLVMAGHFAKKPGGAPANVACAISKLGGQSAFLGAVGHDPFGEFLLEVLGKEGVDTHLAQRTHTFTTLAFVSLSAQGERDFVFSRGADKELKYDVRLKKVFKENMVHFGAATAFLGGELEGAYGRYFFDALTQGSFISFDPNYRENLWKDGPERFIKKCLPYIEKAHLCKFSLEEAQLLSGEQDVDKALDFFHQQSEAIICITLGEAGTRLSIPKFRDTITSVTVDPIDTTGAGDAFMGCLLYQISQLENPFELAQNIPVLTQMVARANTAGAHTTTGYGAIPALPNTEDLEKY